MTPLLSGNHPTQRKWPVVYDGCVFFRGSPPKSASVPCTSKWGTNSKNRRTQRSAWAPVKPTALWVWIKNGLPKRLALAGTKDSTVFPWLHFDPLPLGALRTSRPEKPEAQALVWLTVVCSSRLRSQLPAAGRIRIPAEVPLWLGVGNQEGNQTKCEGNPKKNTKHKIP